jgi:hypothetical protein
VVDGEAADPGASSPSGDSSPGTDAGESSPAAGTATPGSGEAPTAPGIPRPDSQPWYQLTLASVPRAAARARAAWRRATDPAGTAFALVTVAPALIVMAWLVPGAALLLTGRLVPVPMVLLSVPFGVALVMLAAWHMPGRWPAPGPGGKTARTSGRPWAAWWGLGGTLAVAAAFAAWQILENSAELFVSRAPGVYLQVGYWIAEHGSLPIPTTVAAFGGAHHGLTFSSFGFASQGSAVMPQYVAGMPIMLTAGLWAHGVPGAALMSPLLGAFAVLCVGGLTGRLAGPQWAPAGALLLAVTVPEIFTSRSAFSQTLAQALLFGGLCLVIDSLSSPRPAFLAGFGGLALGLTPLAVTSSLVAILPVIVFGGALLAGRRRQSLPFCAGLLAGAGLGLATGVALAVPLYGSTTPALRTIEIMAAAFLTVTAAAAAVALTPSVRRLAATLFASRAGRLLPDAAAVAVASLAVAFAVRPYVQTVRGRASPYVAALQRLEHLRLDPGRLYAEKTLYWLIWYLGVPALLLGVIGLAMVTRLCLRALITWRDPTGMARVWALPAAIIGWGFVVVLWWPGTVPDQPWASQTLVPVVLPGLIVLAVAVAAWLTGRAQERGAGTLAVPAAAACFVVALVVPCAALTFGVGSASSAAPAVRLALTGLAFRATNAGELTAVSSLCGYLPRNSAVLVLDQVAAHQYAQAIRGMCDVPTGVMTGTAPAGAIPGTAGGARPDVQAVVSGIIRAGHQPVLIASQPGELTPYGVPPHQVVNLATTQDAHLLTQPPTSTWPARYVLWMSIPGGVAAGS